MEILEIVAGPLPARLLGQHFAVVAAFPAACNILFTRERDVVWDGKPLRDMPSRLIKKKDSVRAGRDRKRDFLQMKRHDGIVCYWRIMRLIGRSIRYIIS